MTYFLVISFIILLALILRFVQPELIYSLRFAMTLIGSTQANLYSEFQNIDKREEFNSSYVNDRRREVANYDDEYVFERITKLRKLYNILDTAREATPGLPQQGAPQDCIIELADLLGNFGKTIKPDENISDHPIDANKILIFISNRILENKGMSQRMIDQIQVTEWFIDNPASIEQIVEILIAASLLLAYRQQSKTLNRKFPSLLNLPNPIQYIESIKKKLQTLVRIEYEKRYNGNAYKYVHKVLGESIYNDYLSKANTESSLFEELSWIHLEYLIKNESNLFRKAFWSNDKLKSQVDFITTTLTEHFNSKSNPSNILLAVNYCKDIDRRIDYFNKKMHNQSSTI